MNFWPYIIFSLYVIWFICKMTHDWCLCGTLWFSVCALYNFLIKKLAWLTFLWCCFAIRWCIVLLSPSVNPLCWFLVALFYHQFVCYFVFSEKSIMLTHMWCYSATREWVVMSPFRNPLCWPFCGAVLPPESVLFHLLQEIHLADSFVALFCHQRVCYFVSSQKSILLTLL